MTSFLIKTKSNESYEQRIITEPASTQICKKYAIRNFEQFVSETYAGRSIDEIVDELLLVKTDKGQEFEDALYGMLQEWINWNERRDISPSTIKVAFSNLRKYLFYRKIRTNEQDVREYLRIPKTPKEEKHPLSDHEYRVIVDAFAKNLLHQSICLALGSSGMRIGELMNIKKKDLVLSTKRITVKIPPNTKTRTGRTTFFSKEVDEKIKKRLGNLNPDDYVLATNENYSVREFIEKAFSLKGFNIKWKGTGLNEIGYDKKLNLLIPPLSNVKAQVVKVTGTANVPVFMWLVGKVYQ